MRKHYRNREELPIYNFYKILKDGDYLWMYVDYDGYDEFKLEPEIISVWDKLYEEHIKVTGDNEIYVYFEVLQELTYLKTRYEAGTTLLTAMVSYSMTPKIFEEYYEALALWGYKIDREKDLDQELYRITRQIKAGINRIRIKENELKQFEKANEKETSLVKQIVNLEQSLGRNNIDPKTTSVAKYYEMVNLANSINEAKLKSSGK